MITKLKVENLSFKYKNSEDYALNNLNFSVDEGEWVSVLGSNGSGKSTLAKLINGLLVPTIGEIVIDENLVVDDHNIWEVRKRVGMVFQNPDSQFVGVTVEDDIAFGLENNGIPFNEMKEIVMSTLISVRMEGFEKSEPHKLSGGQKQRVAIASAVAVNPSILILDEASSMLDPLGRVELIGTIKKLNRSKGITVLSITHDLEEVVNADRTIVLNKGEIIFNGKPKDLFCNSKIIKDASLDLPNIYKLRNLLEAKNIKINKDIYEIESLVEELWESNSKM